MTKMTEELRRYFLQIAKSVSGVTAIIITDKEGVPVLKVPLDQAPEMALKPRFLSTAATTLDQAGKLGVGANRSIVSVYSKHQVVSLHRHPFIVNIIAREDANTGTILSLESEMQGVLDDMCKAIDGS